MQYAYNLYILCIMLWRATGARIRVYYYDIVPSLFPGHPGDFKQKTENRDRKSRSGKIVHKHIL